MRSSTFSGLAILASALLVEASPILKRDVVYENVVVTVYSTVTAGAEPTPAPAPAPAPAVVVAAAPEPTPEVVVPAPAPAPAPAVVETPAPAPAVEAAPAAPVIKAAEPEPEAPAPVTTTPTASGSGSKRGLAYNDVSLLSAFDNTKASWCYNWGSTSPAGIPSNLEYVPMLWGLQDEHTKGWADIAKKAKHLLAFNEPDHGEQALLSPQTAADGYRKFMNPYAGNAKLGAPAVTNGPADKGMGPEGWLAPFLEKCSDCKIDFVPIHWYDSASNFAYFKSFVEKAHDIAGKPLWLTEFAAAGSQDEQAAFLAQALPFLDSTDYVERYSYFMVSEGNLVSGKALSTVGKAFAQ